MKALDLKVRIELLDHKKYSESTMRRFAHRVTGQKDKFEAKASKEEREYFDAVQEKLKAEQWAQALQQRLEEAQHARCDLDAAAKRHAALQSELDALYASVFDGPTPELPQEDAAEGALTTVRRAYDDAQQEFGTETQVVRILKQAKQVHNSATKNMQGAKSASTMDIWGVGGVYADIAERSSLGQAQANAANMNMMVLQAQNMHPLGRQAVADLPHVEMAQGHVMGDIIFDNVFSDISFDNKIVDSSIQLRKAGRALDHEIVVAEQREGEAKKRLEEVRVRLDGARRELQRVRMEAFQGLGQGNY